MQALVSDKKGVIRFKANAIIDWLFKTGRLDLNEIAQQRFPVEDVEQFWQLLGYSVSGYGDLSFIRRETIAKADALADALARKSEKTP